MTRGGGALAAARAVQHRASKAGFDWPDPLGALEKVREEATEVGALLGERMDGPDGPGAAAPDRSERRGAPDAAAPGLRERPGTPDAALIEEVGDLFFAAVNVARLAGVDPVAAIEGATRKFQRRYRGVVRLAGERGCAMPGTRLEELDRLWNEVKAAERR